MAGAEAIVSETNIATSFEVVTTYCVVGPRDKVDALMRRFARRMIEEHKEPYDFTDGYLTCEAVSSRSPDLGVPPCPLVTQWITHRDIARAAVSVLEQLKQLGNQ